MLATYRPELAGVTVQGVYSSTIKKIRIISVVKQIPDPQALEALGCSCTWLL